MDTGTVRKANAPFWMAIAALLTTSFILMVVLISEYFKLQILSTVCMLLVVVIFVSLARVLIQAAKPSFLEYSNPTAGNAFKARYLVGGEPSEFTLPEPLVL
ncbi:hypothetical protein ACIPV9_01725 [Pseudomonas psychrophila]|uniref:hypothetical protein n=1 Tax=Pseudomonas psychrophila TaxID=122355 RepID=UPI003800039F